jgi:hypothetical protein|nr:MAG TPA: hypothetical protein [Caudoviricetes sp.]
MPIFRDISSFTTLTNDQIKEKVATGWKPYTQVSTTEKVDLYDFLNLVDLSAIYEAIKAVKTEIEEDIQPKLDELQEQITANDTDITNLTNNKKNKQTFSSGDTVTSISGGQTIEVTGTAKVTCNVNATTFTELQDTAYLMALGVTEVEFTSNNGALFINYQNTQLPTGGTKCYKLVRSTQGNQANIYIDVDSYIPVGGAYEIVISANKGTSRDNPLSAGQDTATITAELVTGDIPSGLKPTLSITGEGFSLDPDTGVVNVASRGTTPGAIRSATITASYEDLEPKSITLYQAENKITGYNGTITVTTGISYPNISSSGGNANPSGPSWSQEATYSSGESGTANNVGSVSFEKISGDSAFSVDSRGTVSVGANPSFDNTRSATIRATITNGSESATSTDTVVQAAATRTDIVISCSISQLSGSINLSAPAQDRLSVRLTIYEVDGQGNTTGVGFDTLDYTINVGQSSISVVDRPDSTWIDFRADVYEVNGITNPPLQLDNGVYTWDLPS